jgi:general secretion pathway protein N
MISGRLRLLIGLVILGMAMCFGVMSFGVGSSLGDPISAKVIDDYPRGNPLWSIPVKTLAATRDRPIFSPSRRPPPSPVIAAPQVLPPPVSKPTEPERPRLTLVGTVTGEQEAFGIFLDQTANKIVRLRLGDDHLGWILRQVRGREVMLQKDGETTFLALPPPGSKPAVAGTRVADEPERRRFSR